MTSHPESYDSVAKTEVGLPRSSPYKFLATVHHADSHSVKVVILPPSAILLANHSLSHSLHRQSNEKTLTDEKVVVRHFPHRSQRGLSHIKGRPTVTSFRFDNHKLTRQ
jgi:hypothetical protein